MFRVLLLLSLGWASAAFGAPTIYTMGTASRDFQESGINRAVTAVATTSVSVGLSSVVIAQPNPLRKGFFIWNNGANSAYISFNPVSNSSKPTLILPTFQQFQMTSGTIWTGYISAIRNAGTGTLTVWELQ